MNKELQPKPSSPGAPDTGYKTEPTYNFDLEDDDRTQVGPPVSNKDQLTRVIQPE